MPSTSATERSRHSTSRVLALYRVPWQSGHGAYTLGRNSSSTITLPSPSHVGQRPPTTLNENRPALYPRSLASSVAA